MKKYWRDPDKWWQENEPQIMHVKKWDGKVYKVNDKTELKEILRKKLI